MTEGPEDALFGRDGTAEEPLHVDPDTAADRPIVETQAPWPTSAQRRRLEQERLEQARLARETPDEDPPEPDQPVVPAPARRRPEPVRPQQPRVGLPVHATSAAPRPEARPRIVEDPDILGISRRARSRVGSRLFTLFFVLIFVLILVQLIVSLVEPPL